jgi:hypothetical protein
MLAKPTIPMIPTMIDVRTRRPQGPIDSPFFEGWGVRIFDNRIL